jgi:hypothetical protein
MEKNLKKAAALAEQRPCWAVYCGDAVKLLAAGVGFHLPVNFVDVDPYGSPWDILKALFQSARRLPDRWGLAVNDGLKKYLELGGGYKSAVVKPFVEQWGNRQVAGRYPEICRELVEKMAGEQGLRLEWWYCREGGYHGMMTHYSAVLARAK